MVDDLIYNTKNNLKNYKIDSPIDIEQQKVKIVSLSDEMIEHEKKLKLFLKQRMYLHPRIRTMTLKARKNNFDLFDLFIDEPHLMPKNWNIFKDEFDKYTKVSDYISGMTDKFAINTYSKFLIYIVFNVISRLFKARNF